MSLSNRIVRAVIVWLVKRYPYQVKDVLLGPKAHIHRNPRKRRCSDAE